MLIIVTYDINTVIKSNNGMLDHELENLSVEKVINSIKETLS